MRHIPFYKIALLLIILSWCRTDICPAELEQEQYPVSYMLISSENMKHANNIIHERISAVFPDIKQVLLDCDSEQALQYRNTLNIQFIPFVIYDKSIASTSQFFSMIKQDMIAQSNGYYILPERYLLANEVMFLNRKRLPNQLILYATGFCPYSIDAAVSIMDFIGKHSLETAFTMKYIIKIDEFGMQSLRGQEELKEDIKQIIIQRYISNKFRDYMQCLREKGPEKAMEEAGILDDIIKDKRQNALDELKAHYDETTSIGIKHSPKFLLENIYLFSDINTLQEYEPFNSKKTVSSGKYKKDEPIPIHFFYSNGCSQCLDIKNTLVPAIESQYKEKTDIHYHNISESSSLALWLSMREKYDKLGSGAVPEIFLPDRVLCGDYIINKQLKESIDELFANNISETETAKMPMEPDKNIIADTFSRFSPAVVACAGLADGINPCAFTALIFFVSFLTLYSYSRLHILTAGISFIAALLITYLALGLGGAIILGAIEKLRVASIVLKYAISLIAFGLCALTINDIRIFKRTGKIEGLKLQLPFFIKNRISGIIAGTYRQQNGIRRNIIGLSAITFLCGIIIAGLESACTGQIYLPTIAFIMKTSGMRMRAFGYLVLYNAAFIMPLIIIFLFAYKGVSSRVFAELSQRHIVKIKIIYALLFFMLGAMVIIL